MGPASLSLRKPPGPPKSLTGITGKRSSSASSEVFFSWALRQFPENLEAVASLQSDGSAAGAQRHETSHSRARYRSLSVLPGNAVIVLKSCQEFGAVVRCRECAVATDAQTKSCAHGGDNRHSVSQSGSGHRQRRPRLSRHTTGHAAAIQRLNGNVPELQHC